MAKNMPYMAKGQITAHFALWEFCNAENDEEIKIEISPEFIEHVQMLEMLRTMIGHPLDVSSGWRSKKYNEECGGSPDSAHLVGLATDVYAEQSELPLLTRCWKAVCKAFNKVGGINYYPWGVHLCSNEDRFGNKDFTIRDKRKAA